MIRRAVCFLGAIAAPAATLVALLALGRTALSVWENRYLGLGMYNSVALELKGHLGVALRDAAAVFLLILLAVALRRLVLRVTGRSPTAPGLLARGYLRLAGAPGAALGFTAALITLLGLAAAYPLHLAGATAEGKPHVILIVVDTLRADHIGAYGSDLQLTPNIDRFSGEALVFLNAVAEGSNTINSSASLLSSLYVSEHGYFDYDSRLSDEIVTLPEMLREIGYRTFGISTNPHVSSRNGLGQGFDTFIEDTSWRHTDAREVNDRFLSWTREGDDRPFFGMLWYIDPHEPYDPPSESMREPVPEELDALVGERTRRPGRVQRKGGKLSEPEKALASWLYRAEVSYVDSEFGRLMGTLDRLGILEDSLIILTADHGEAFWEHRDPLGEFFSGHGRSLHREEINVPLIIRLPGGARRGRIRERAGLIDILPTALDVAGVSDHARFAGDRRGTSLVNPVTADAGRLRPFSFSELITWEYGPYIMRSVQNDDVKLVRTYRYGDQEFDPPLEQWLDLHEGEEEVSRASQEAAGIAADIERAFAGWLAGMRAVESERIHLDRGEMERLQERLKALGYIE
jgi:arylsulfatase